ncbi:hypothetical protein [Methylosarcina fibrata]|uniref:hypothetical protein n=1 Tax=Methylosarcina fibrata TaxID=105972 RepID=UPI00036AB1A3|nr:hypothetical protein [Methylosarcina fibrata]
MNFLKKIIKWELENILNEKQWEFFLMDGYESFNEKINNRVALINKDKFEYNPRNKSNEKSFYGCISDNVLTIILAKEQPPLSYINPTYFYFRGKIYAKENVIKGSFRRSDFFRLTSLFLLNAYFLHIIAYILYLVFSFIFYNRLEINYSIFFIATFGVVFLTSFIAIESSILRFFSKSEEKQIYKLLSDLAS